MVWVGLAGAAVVGLTLAIIRPGEVPESEPTPPPTPSDAALYCLDGASYVSVDEQVEPPAPGEDPSKQHWSLTFAKGGYTLDKGARREAGTYRCDGNQIQATGSGGAHRGTIDPTQSRIVWDALGFEKTGAAPKTTGTSG